VRTAAARKILLVKLTRMGDILEAQPLLRDLRSQEPNARITMVVNEAFRGAAELLPEVDEILSFPLFDLVKSMREGQRDLVGLYRWLETFSQALGATPYDLALNLTNSRLSGMLMGFLKARQSRGLWYDGEGLREVVGPLIRYFGANEGMRRLSAFNLSDFMRCLYGSLGQTPPSTLKRSAEAEAQADDLLSSDPSVVWVGIQLGASEACKRWRVEDFARMASQLLAQTNVQLVLLGSGDEKPLATAFLEQLQGDRSRVVSGVGRTSLQALVAVTARLKLLITNDTGTMHMAACLDVPVLNISLGSAFFRETGPYGEGHVILEPRILCRPCDFNSLCSHHDCKALIPPEPVAAIAEAMLQGRSGLWERLAPTLATCKTFDVFETQLDQDLLLDYARKTPRPLLHDEVLLHVFRMAILQSELGGEFELRLADGIQRMLRDGTTLYPDVEAQCRESLARFETIEALSVRGARHIDTAMDALYAEDRDAVQYHMEAANAIDRELYQLGRQHADARLLMRTYVLTKESLRSERIEMILRGDHACFNGLQAVVAWSRIALTQALEALEKTSSPSINSLSSMA